SSEGKPPVPSSSRERSSRPAITSGSSTAAPVAGGASDMLRSSSLHRRQDLDPGAVGERPRAPFGAGHDLAVDRHRDAARLNLQAELGERGGRGAGLGELAGAAVQDDRHSAAAPARSLRRRAGSHASISAASSSPEALPSSKPARSSAVSGASRIPLRWWPVAHSSPSSAPGPIAGRL